MALGVRADLPDVALALSYWIAYLRTCSPSDPNSRCHNLFNMDTILHHYTATRSCPQVP